MRVKIFSDRYSLLVPLMDYLVTKIEETPTPVGISGPHKSRRCNGMSPQLLVTEYDRDLGFWKLNSAQNRAFFTSVYYCDYTDVAINRLKSWLDSIFVSFKQQFDGSLNFEELLPEQCGGRFGIRIEYSISLMLLALDPSLLFAESKYPPIAYELLAEHIKFIQTNTFEFVDEDLSLELVERAHVKAPTVSVALQKMEEDGLITRVTSLDDQRYVKVQITEKGRNLCKEMKDFIYALDLSLTEDISEEELLVTRGVLTKIIDKMLEGKKK